MPEPTRPNHTVAETSPPAASERLKFGPPMADGEVGTLGPYRVRKELGKGGMGAVYLAIDTRLGRELAMKVMLPEFAADASAKERFLREAQAAAKVSHDNVVTVYEADERDGVPYIAMQLLRGCPLDEYLSCGQLTLAQAVAVGRDAAQGLAAAHKLGLVHRDIKPANLWLEAGGGRVKVLDFGLAKPVGTDTELTKSGAVMGTPTYMSPEQARGLKVDHRADLWSLGVVLYRLCTGKTPFAGEHVMAVLAAVLTDEPTPVRDLNPEVPEPLAALIHQLLSKKPEQRPQSANEVARQLRAVLDGSLAPSAVSASLPVQTAVRPEDVFADLGTEDLTEVDRAEEPRPARKTGGKGVLIAAAVAVLLAPVAGAVVVALSSKGKKEPEAKERGTEKTPPVKPNPAKTDLAKPPEPTLPAAHKNGVGMEFVRVPKGVGWLGGGSGKPGHLKVEIGADFYLGKYEVTQAEWEAVMGTNPSSLSRTGKRKDVVKDIPDADLKRFPVESVSWDDCQEFVRKLNEREKEVGWMYRLPTLGEYEYALRGGPVDQAASAFDFYFARPTNTLRPEQANFAPAPGKGLRRPCKVGSYEPNPLGLFDMHGNVWEWCGDAPEEAGPPQRKNRGGSWSDYAVGCEAASYGVLAQAATSSDCGLRVARVPAADPNPDVPGTHTNGIGMKFVPVPKGTGWLGGRGGKPGAREVAFDQDFYLGKYEVTQAEWEAVMDTNPSRFARAGMNKNAVRGISDADLSRFPVEMVSWDECQKFIERLNAREKDTGWVYRLPKADEWEYACRGGPVDRATSAFDFYFAKPTNMPSLEQANFAPEPEKGLQRPCKVGTYAPNALGLFDMHGNVWEWCDNVISALEPLNREDRGGGWHDDAETCRAAFRGNLPETKRRSGDVGLRVARVPAGK